jgi:hypothetical protein
MNDDEGKQKDEAKQKKDLIIPRNALFGIAPAVAITAVLSPSGSSSHGVT